MFSSFTVAVIIIYVVIIIGGKNVYRPIEENCREQESPIQWRENGEGGEKKLRLRSTALRARGLCWVVGLGTAGWEGRDHARAQLQAATLLFSCRSTPCRLAGLLCTRAVKMACAPEAAVRQQRGDRLFFGAAHTSPLWLKISNDLLRESSVVSFFLHLWRAGRVENGVRDASSWELGLLNLGGHLTCREWGKLRLCPLCWCTRGEPRTGKSHWDEVTSILLWLSQSHLFESRLQSIAGWFYPKCPGECDTGSLINACMYWYDLSAFHSCMSLWHYY